jgi:hypothetical protein
MTLLQLLQYFGLFVQDKLVYNVMIFVQLYKLN